MIPHLINQLVHNVWAHPASFLEIGTVKFIDQSIVTTWSDYHIVFFRNCKAPITSCMSEAVLGGHVKISKNLRILECCISNSF